MKATTLILLAAIIVVFIIQQIVPITDAFALHDVTTNPWTLLTSMFLHGDMNHLLGNVFALLVFGLILENQIGSKKFLTIYFIGGIIAGIFASFFYASSLGASGAIFTIIGTLAVLKPKMTVPAFGVPMPMIIAALFWLMLDIAGAFYPSNIANMAHIAGLAFGAAIGFFLRSKEPPPPKKREKVLTKQDLDQWEEDWM